MIKYKIKRKNNIVLTSQNTRLLLAVNQPTLRVTIYRVFHVLNDGYTIQQFQNVHANYADWYDDDDDNVQ